MQPPETKLSLAHSTDEYTAFDPFLDCDRDTQPARCRTVSVIKTRAVQICVSLSSGSHEIPAGTIVRFERAYVPEIGTFSSFCVCIACCDREMTPGFWKSLERG